MLFTSLSCNMARLFVFRIGRRSCTCSRYTKMRTPFRYFTVAWIVKSSSLSSIG